MKIANQFSGALRSFAYFMASGTHYMLAEVDYLGLYGEDPGAIEMCYAILAIPLRWTKQVMWLILNTHKEEQRTT